MNLVEQLLATPLGGQLGKACCEVIGALCSTRNISAGASLFHAGDKAENMYIVLSGRLNVQLAAENQDDLVVAVLGPGGLAGELETYTQTPRMAGIVAVEDSVCAALPGHYLRQRPAEHAEALAALVDVIAYVMAMRLNAVDSKLKAAWSLPEAGATTADLNSPPLRDVLDDVLRWA